MEFNKSQREAILHRDGPMLVLAGPGSGKTSVITGRAEYLVKSCKVSPSNLLVLTFSRAAAKEMRQRFLKRMGRERMPVTFGTFHAVFFQVLQCAYHFERANLLSEEQRTSIMRELLSRYPLDYSDEPEFMAGLFAEIGRIKNDRLDLRHYYSTSCGEEVFRELYAAYQERLRRSRLLDFDDILTDTYDLFAERKDILSAWQRKYPYILIDEFQDINRIQYDIVRMMAEPCNNLFVVGDDDQSIYRFRGARPELMLDFPRDYPDAKQVVLDVNYRSLPGLVEAAGRLIACNKNRFEKKTYAARKGLANLTFQCFEDQRQENEWIIRKIQRKIAGGTAPGEIAVLCRTNMQPRLLTEQMAEQNLPFRSREHMPDLYAHWIARDIFAYLRLAEGGRERADVLAVMNRPKRYLARDSLPESRVDFDAWLRWYADRPWIAERIEKLERDLAFLHTMSPYAAVNYIRLGIGYDDFLLEYASERGIEKEELFAVADEIQAGAKGYRTVEAWTAHIRDYREKMRLLEKDGDAARDAVNIATLHAVKGLEYGTVFLLDVNEGVMPYRKAVLDADIEEERRLFYVGMTRAKDSLHLAAVKRLRGREAEISRFVKEIGI